MSRLALGLALGLAGARGEDCGVAWGNDVLAPSGARDCGGCGEGIESYASCAEASRDGAAFLGVGGLGGRETWDGPPGCHIQEGSNFQWNTNLAGRASPGHTPVCYQAGASPPPRSDDFVYCAAASEEVCREKDHPEPGLNTDEDCCTLEQAAKCKEGYRYSRGAKCWEGSGCHAYKTCCTPCDDFEDDCENKNSKWGEDTDCDDDADGLAAVIVVVVVVVSVVVCCAVVGAVVFCAYHRRQAVQSMAPYYGSQPFYESQPPVLPPATTELVVVHGQLVEPAPAAGPAVLPGTFAK